MLKNKHHVKAQATQALWQYESCKIIVFVWGEFTCMILKFVEN